MFEQMRVLSLFQKGKTHLFLFSFVFFSTQLKFSTKFDIRSIDSNQGLEMVSADESTEL